MLGLPGFPLHTDSDDDHELSNYQTGDLFAADTVSSSAVNAV